MRRPYLHSLVCLLVGCSFAPSPIEGGDGTTGDSGPVDGRPGDAGCAWGYTPTGFAECPLPFGAPLAIDMAGEHGLDLATGMLTAPDSSTTTLMLSDLGEGVATLLAVESLSVASGATLKVIGTQPLVIAVNSEALVSGAIDVSGSGAGSGPGGGRGCEATTATLGDSATTGTGAGGGGGGGFGARGGAGGNGESATGSGGEGGMMVGTVELTPLRGGCPGAAGGPPLAAGDSTAGVGGGAGGALQISARTRVTVDGGQIRASGGGGRAAVGGDRDSNAGGGGGGSGGGIFLEAERVSLANGGVLCANGGSGGEGAHEADTTEPGLDGLCETAAATTPAGTANTGNGGDGGALVSEAGGAGGDGHGGQHGGGGGGGGSVGRILIRRIVDDTDTTGCSPDPLETR